MDRPGKGEPYTAPRIQPVIRAGDYFLAKYFKNERFL